MPSVSCISDVGKKGQNIKMFYLFTTLFIPGLIARPWPCKQLVQPGFGNPIKE
jgi:hypothetical protein